jgi:hypothetical protein
MAGGWNCQLTQFPTWSKIIRVTVKSKIISKNKFTADIWNHQQTQFTIESEIINEN